MKRTPLKRKTPMKRMSKRRQTESKIYSKKRAAFLAERPVCEICGVRASTDIHHVGGRAGGLYLDETHWLALCRPDHDFLHRKPRLSREMGYIGKREAAT